MPHGAAESGIRHLVQPVRHYLVPHPWRQLAQQQLHQARLLTLRQAGQQLLADSVQVHSAAVAGGGGEVAVVAVVVVIDVGVGGDHPGLALTPPEGLRRLGDCVAGPALEGGPALGQLDLLLLDQGVGPRAGHLRHPGLGL